MTYVNNAKNDTLHDALIAREQEIEYYQINITNYKLAIEEIGKLPPSEQEELSEFSSQLKELLRTEIMEQKKSKIMLSVIRQQVV
jgi:hypothetical protein